MWKLVVNILQGNETRKLPIVIVFLSKIVLYPPYRYRDPGTDDREQRDRLTWLLCEHHDHQAQLPKPEQGLSGIPYWKAGKGGIGNEGPLEIGRYDVYADRNQNE